MNLSICTADIGLADTFFTLADGWSFGLHGHSFGHVLSTRYLTVDTREYACQVEHSGINPG